jgi:hypothetical protein
MKYQLIEYLNQFPNDATSWAQATDEVRDLARTIKEFYNDEELDKVEPCDFRFITKPSVWNTKGKNYIFEVYSKMNKSKKSFDKYLHLMFAEIKKTS